MTYTELVTAIQSYTENQFPTVYLADGTTESSTTQINRFIEQAEQRIYNTIQFPSLRSNVTGTLTAGNQYLSCPNDFLSVYSLAVYPTTGTYANQYTYLINKDVNFLREAFPSTNAAYQGQPQYYALFGPQYGDKSLLSFMLGPTPDQSYAAELHYYYYPPTIIQGAITAVTITAGGNTYTSGTYYDVPVSYATSQPTPNAGGSINGNSAVATVVVTGNAVTSITITNGGALYSVGDILTVSGSYIGSSGSGFTCTVSSVSNAVGYTWLSDNYDSVLLYGSLVEAYTFMKSEPDIIAGIDAKYKEALMEAKRLGDGLERQDAYRSGQYRQKVT